MQNLISIVATEPKAINAPKNGKDADPSKTKDSSKDFVAILFDQIKNNIKLDVSAEIKTSEKSDKVIDAMLKNDKKKPSSDLLLNEVLNIISLIKSPNENIKFPKFSDKLEKILNNKSILNEFLSAKNIGDIKKISKKYDLGLENIKFTKEKIQTLQKDFPKLDVKKFFEVKTEQEPVLNAKDIPKIAQNNKTIIIKNIIKNLPADKEDSSKNILQTLLKTIDKKTEQVIVQTNEQDKKNKVNQFIKKDVKTETVGTNKNIDIKTTLAEDKVIPTIKKDIKTETVGTNKNIDIKTTLAEDKVIPTIKIKKTKEDKVSEKKSLTRTDSLKLNHSADDVVLKDFKMKKNEKTINLNNIQNLSTKTSLDDDSKKDKEVKHEPTINKNEFKTQTKIETLKTVKPLHVRESLSQFSTDLKEKVESYKPPLMKLQMALNPKDLGEVKVTLLTRGNNLHVNITSNTNTMSLFTQNQAEFKNSLVNMGFTNLEMNFSDQGKNNQQNQNSKQSKNQSFDETQNQENYESTVELIVPQYV